MLGSWWLITNANEVMVAWLQACGSVLAKAVAAIEELRAAWPGFIHPAGQTSLWGSLELPALLDSVRYGKRIAKPSLPRALTLIPSPSARR